MKKIDGQARLIIIGKRGEQGQMDRRMLQRRSRLMGYQPLEQLLPRANYSIYKLVCLASKRAMELAEGSAKLIPSTSSFKTATIAFEEIAAGKVMLKAVAEQMAKTVQKASRDQKDKEAHLEKEDKVGQEQGV